MSRTLNDLTGKRFGNLEVIAYHGLIKKNPAWEVKCACGNKKVVLALNLRAGHTTGCGRGCKLRKTA